MRRRGWGILEALNALRQTNLTQDSVQKVGGSPAYAAVAEPGRPASGSAAPRAGQQPCWK